MKNGSSARETECAAVLMEVVPSVMRSIQAEMQTERTGLSFPQFQALTFLSDRRGASLSHVADHLCLRLPAASKLVDGLVGRGLVVRAVSPTDRRRLTLALTRRGNAALESARRATELHLARMLKGVPVGDRISVVQAMEALRPVFAAAPAAARDRRDSY
jgi:DNA-binding MarR family transcriptional regulator